MTTKCVQPDAPWVQCCVCGMPVKTCERQVAIEGDYRCPAHPDGAELDDGRWVCSLDCWSKIVDAKENEDIRLDIAYLRELCEKATKEP